MGSVGVYEAEWALSKVLPRSDVDPNQNRLMLAQQMVWGGPIPRLFPELELVDDDSVQNAVVILIDANAGVEKVATVRYVDVMSAYRISGRGWWEFARDSGILEGDRIDLYVGRRGNDEPCLLFF
uniref:Uncharacterized protein n=1 Tax=Triticum urartu TaxID=4572 RepID=A0A8R7RA54_TRIUA